MPKDKYSLANRTIEGLVKLPMVRVNRKNFLKTQFKDDENLKGIIKNGPQAYYSANELRDMADVLIKDNVTKAASASVLAGLPSNPLIMLGTGAADIAQYFGLALRMAQQLAYLFGEDDLFNPKSHLNEVERGRLLGLLGGMFGVSGATSLIYLGSQKMAEPLGTKIAGKAMLEGVKHPMMKKVGSSVGHRISHQTLGQTVTKAVPLVGGVTSGVITYVTFKPMGQRLANLLADNLATQQASPNASNTKEL
ncbi:hypothetical protein [Weissella viridescens]|uniref:hypothetical protein n=1 Tax=Weissella viridescens TaxID=1629 RepID=UPI0022E1AE77|nr:hypothetical protein [Weissella viridescens]